MNPQHAESWPGAALGQVRTILDELVATHHQRVHPERLRAFREMPAGTGMNSCPCPHQFVYEAMGKRRVRVDQD